MEEDSVPSVQPGPGTKRDLIRDLLIRDERVRVGLREVNIWRDTIQAWLEQGYPTQRVVDEHGDAHELPVDWRDHFGYDMVAVAVPFDSLPLRGYYEVVEETDEWVVVRNGGGAALKRWKHKSGTPEHIDFRMTTREVWEREYRPHLLKVDRERIDIQGAKRDLQRRREQGLYTYYQHLFIWENMRRTMGDICLYQSMALDPDWIHDYNRVWTDFFKAHFQILLEEAGVPDGVRLCEDLGYKNGLFCSPRMYAELIFPYYKEIVDILHGYGMLVELHTCGSVTDALPLIVETGFDILNPMEVKAGNDVFQFAEQYGEELAFAGGLDVRVLESGDRDLIRHETTRLVEGMKARGARYVFGSDHSLTTNIRYDDYLYAIQVYRDHMIY
jgi:uroporphyrinogen decarboxylase